MVLQIRLRSFTDSLALGMLIDSFRNGTIVLPGRIRPILPGVAGQGMPVRRPPGGMVLGTVENTGLP
jgi:hypothetical protein